MNRIAQLDPSQAIGRTKQLLDNVHAEFGFVPNFFRILGNAPAALEGYLKFKTALAGGSLDARVREQIALTVAESNMCRYCLIAHTHLAGKLGLTQNEIISAIHAAAVTTKTDGILKLARNIVVQRGEMSDPDLDQARDCGLTDGEILETLANVALNIFTNYANHMARTVVDFPEVKPGKA